MEFTHRIEYEGHTFHVLNHIGEQSLFVEMQVDQIREQVFPMPNGYLTRPHSEISNLLGKRGSALIPDNTYAYKLYKRSREFYELKEQQAALEWLYDVGMYVQGGLLYGALDPLREPGWYIVHMRKVGVEAEYVSHRELNYLYLEESTYCKKLWDEFESKAFFTYKGFTYPVALISKENLYTLYELEGNFDTEC